MLLQKIQKSFNQFNKSTFTNRLLLIFLFLYLPQSIFIRIIKVFLYEYLLITQCLSALFFIADGKKENVF